MLTALAAGVAAGDEDRARGAVARADWILRGPVRRRLEAALIEASLASGVLEGSPPGAARHRLQAAALLVAAPRSPAAPHLADAAAVARAYAALPARPPPRVPLATLGAAAALAVLLAGIGGGLAHAVGAGAAASDARPPPPAGALRDGGTPARDLAIEALLAAVVDASAAPGPGPTAPRRAGAPAEGAPAELRDPPALAPYGAPLRAAWRDLVDAVALPDRRGAADLPGAAGLSAPRRAASAELSARARALSDQLAGAGLGYTLDAAAAIDPGAAGSIALAAYRIEDVAFVRAGTRRVRVLGVRPVASPATAPGGHELSALGVSRPGLEDPLVLLARVDAKIEQQLLPVLGGAPLAIGGAGWAGSPASRHLAQAAGQAVRRELLAALGAAAASPAATASRLRGLVAASIGRHEAQHGLDRAGGALAHPQALVHALGRVDAAFALRARHELSAYLSQLASDTWLPQAVLWALARHAFRDSIAGIEEAYVAVVVLDRLARHRGAPPAAPPLVRDDGRVDRDRLAASAAPLAALSTLELRAAAAAGWEELFGAPLVRLYGDL